MSGVVPEANAVRPVYSGSGPRSNLPSAESADQASPFASMLDETSDTPPPPQARPAAPPPQLPNQKPAVSPQDGQAPQSSSGETTPPTQPSPSDGPASEAQTGSASSLPPKGSQGTDIASTMLALEASVRKAAKDATIGANGGATVSNGGPNVSHGNDAADATGGDTAIDASEGGSPAAAVSDIHGAKSTKSGASADATQATTPPFDPSASQPASAMQAVAVPVGAPVMPVATTGTESDGDTRQDAPSATVGGGSGSDSLTGAGAKPGADGTSSTPSLTPRSAQHDLNSLTGAGQTNAADGTQSRHGSGAAAAEAAVNQARQQTANNLPANAATGTASNSKLDPNIGPSSDSNITWQILDTTIRRTEAQGDDASSAASPADSTQPSGAQPPSLDGSLAPAILTTSTAPAAAPSTNPTPAAAIPIAGLAIEIASHAHAGNNRFEIRLDPPELGRIDVRLEVDHEGKVTSRLVVDRPETLDMLRRDAPQLERSLQQAGLKTADNALQFSLRDHGGFGSQNPYSNSGSPTVSARVIVPDQELPPVDAAVAGYGRMTGTGTGIDIRV